jgi:hypothetical protein
MLVENYTHRPEWTIFLRVYWLTSLSPADYPEILCGASQYFPLNIPIKSQSQFTEKLN